MLFNEFSNPLIVIVGPTAVGKTEISIQLAERMNGEIVSADSRLFYRGMDIGTAKPSIEERKRVVHHLIDVSDPDDVWNLAFYQKEAFRIINEIQARNVIPILVGGTGQYIRSIVEAWNIPLQSPDLHLREVLSRWGEEIGPQGLYKRLIVVDPNAAIKIEPQNMRRTIRALEVIFNTGKRFSIQKRKGKTPYNILQVGLKRPREELYKRIDTRIDLMLETGFLDEVRSLIILGYGSELPTMSAIGYREMISYIKGEITFDEAVKQMKKLTRQFVRRQANWFKESDPQIHWFEVNEFAVDEIEKFILSGRSWMKD